MEDIADHLQISVVLHCILFNNHIHDRQDHGNAEGFQHSSDQHQKDKQDHLLLLLSVQQYHQLFKDFFHNILLSLYKIYHYILS